MPPLIRALSRRDAVLILIGALSMHFFTSFAPLTSQSIVKAARFHEQANDEPPVHEYPPHNDQEISELLAAIPPESSSELGGQSTTSQNMDFPRLSSLPETTIVDHVPGWTLFRDIYMANGTLLILTSSSSSSFPDTRYMISTGLPSENNPENIALREPTPRNMRIVTPEEALQLWGNHPSTRRVWSVEGNTLLINDPPQFLAHYYHFCAEILLGTWAFWTGVHSGPPPPIHRAIFPYSSNVGWRDHPGLNGYFLRAAFPSLTVEVDVDWNDRVVATSASIDSDIHRAWHFPYLLLTDRSAANRGDQCGSTHRMASEPVDGLVARSMLDKYGSWWRPIKYAIWRFAGVTIDDEEGFFGNHALDDKSPTPPPPEFEETEKIVITYISRQHTGRRLIPEDHEALVENLEALVQRKNADITSMVHTGGIAGKQWELNVVRAEEMTKDDQVRVVARTTILLGVHGNGLSHLILMPRTNVSAVIEMFYPGGFSHDYEWTTRALGMKHFGVRNDTYFTENTPEVMYPEGFQGDRIPVYGPNVASIIEKRVAGEL